MPGHDERERERERELPDHETRPEGPEGAGLTTSGISAEQYGPVDEDVLEAQEDEGAATPDEPPPYRVPSD